MHIIGLIDTIFVYPDICIINYYQGVMHNFQLQMLSVLMSTQLVSYFKII